MTSPAIAEDASRLMIFLADAAVRSIVLACLAALSLAVLRVRQVTVNLAVWTGVLYAALAMPLLAWMTPAIFLRVPMQLSAAGTPSLNSRQISGQEQTGPARGQSVVDRRLSGAGASIRTGEGPRSSMGALATPQIGGQEAAAGKLPQLPPKLALELGPALARLTRIAAPARILAVYTLGLAFLLGHLITGIFLGRRLRRSFTRVDDPRALRLVERNARAIGLKRAPSLADSLAVSVPLTVGVFHPVIVIPTGWREWPSAKLVAVIAHEVSHVRRNDSRTRAAVLVYQCFFWFSPLAWWLERHLADLAEQASDEAAIRAGTEPTEYAEVLLSFLDISTRQGRVSWHGISMARGLRARNRIERVLTFGGALPAAMKTPILVLLALCALPIVWLTAATRPVLVVSSDSVAAKPLTQNVADQQFLPPVTAGPETSPLTPAAVSKLPLLAHTGHPKVSSFPEEKTGQQQTPPQATISGDSTGFYASWLKSPVTYFATEEERLAFRKLTTDEQREGFIEQFWERRNPKPGSSENWFRQEFYRRVRFANSNFSTLLIPGWKTDRGRVYIQYGTPDPKESYPLGTVVHDSTGVPHPTMYPFERWFYWNVDRLGSNRVLVFADPTNSGDYHLMLGPQEKDDLLLQGGRAQLGFRPPPPLATPRREDLSVTMCILIDNSGSMRDKRAEVMAASLTLVKASKPHDDVCIVDFNDEANIVVYNHELYDVLPYGEDFNRDIKEMERALTHIDSRGGSAMRDATRLSIDQVEQTAHNARKVLVLVSDGNDTSSQVTQEQLLGKVKNSGVRAYCIGLLDEDDPGQAARVRLALGQLAEASGGLAYFPKDLAEVERISHEIENEVRKR